MHQKIYSYNCVVSVQLYAEACNIPGTFSNILFMMVVVCIHITIIISENGIEQNRNYTTKRDYTQECIRRRC